jgi:hypothetical protein
MTGQSKLRWVEIPRRSLRDGLACGEGGARVMLFMGDDRMPAGSQIGTGASRTPQPDPQPAEKPR